MRNLVYCLLIAFTFSACAAVYRPITPTSVNYQVENKTDDVTLAYKYNILAEKGNKRYAAKEQKFDYHVIALKVENRSSQDYTFNKDLLLTANGSRTNLIQPAEVTTNVKQTIPTYLLFLLLTPTTLETESTSIPIGLGLGPILTIGNMASAGSSNKKFLNQLTQYNLDGKTIKAGETVYGLVTIPANDFSPLSLEIAGQ